MLMKENKHKSFHLITVTRKVYRALTVGANLVFYMGLVGLSSMLVKNIHEQRPYLNIRGMIQKSDYKQMNYLNSLLDTPLSDFSNFQVLNSLVDTESIVLALAFHSYALTNIAIQDPAKKEEKQVIILILPFRKFFMMT